jgi:putative ABC transport system permease protein
MTAVWYRVRADLRDHWRAVLGLALLVGVAGGAVLGATAGARRTSSAYSRFLDASNAGDVLVNPNTPNGAPLPDYAAMARLPQVRDSAFVAGIDLIGRDATGRIDPSWYDVVNIASGDGRMLRRMERPKLVAGRLPDPERWDELYVNEALARNHHLHVGSRVPMVWYPESVVQYAQDPSTLPPGAPLDLTVVGIGRSGDDIVRDPNDVFEQYVGTPALIAEIPTAVSFGGLSVRLKHRDADLSAFEDGVRRIVKTSSVFFQEQRSSRVTTQRAVRPSVVALVVFAVLAGIAALLVVGQAIARQIGSEASDFPSLRTLGMSTSQLFSVAAARALLVAAVGAVLAVGVAVLVSPLSPIGVVRGLEIDPGFHVDALVLTLGGFATFALVMATAIWPAWRASRQHAGGQGRAEVVPTRASRLAERVARAGAPVPAVAGIRMALEPGRGRTSVPVRSTVAGVALGLAALLAVLGFGSSLTHFVATPRLYGQDWDLTVKAGPGVDATSAVKNATTDPNIAGFTLGGFAQVNVAGVDVAAVGLEPRVGSTYLTLLDGRPARTATEVVLGSTTLGRTGKSIGDRVRVVVGERSATMRVVGRAVFPRFAAYQLSDRTGLGVGAAFTVRGIKRVLPEGDASDFVQFGLVSFKPGVDRAAAVARVKREATVRNIASPHSFVARLRPSDIVGYESVDRVPLVLAGLLAFLAVASATHALFVTIRRRRRDLAVFKTLGFTRRQVSSSIAWQATTIGLAALLIGIPLGIVLGRVGWTLLAHELGAVAEPIWPVGAALLAVPITLVFVNLLAYFPGRLAARTRPAVVLRSE